MLLNTAKVEIKNKFLVSVKNRIRSLINDNGQLCGSKIYAYIKQLFFNREDIKGELNLV